MYLVFIFIFCAYINIDSFIFRGNRENEIKKEENKKKMFLGLTRKCASLLPNWHEMGEGEKISLFHFLFFITIKKNLNCFEKKIAL